MHIFLVLTLDFRACCMYNDIGGDYLIKQSIDVIGALKDAGFSSYRLRHERILGESCLTKLRAGGLPSWNELNTICSILSVQPGTLIEYVPDDVPSGNEDTQVLPR